MSQNNSQLAALIDLSPSVAEFRASVWAGLAQHQKTIPAKFFYDREGSRLFEEICLTPEYYPTRTEKKLLADVVSEIAGLAGPGRAVLEFGSGAGVKTRALLDRLDAPAAYVPVEISRARLVEVTSELAADYPKIQIAPVCADYTKPFNLPSVAMGVAHWLGFFPGSTIGNFTPPQAVQFLSQVRRMLGTTGLMLIGVDLRKDIAVLNAAYNDAAGVTADFNLNLLTRINRELDGDFDLSQFGHSAFYEPEQGRIEMHLISRRAQSVNVAGRAFDFAADETIHTENSYKYDVDQFRCLAASAGWSHRAVWTDSDRLFSLHLLACE
ncbi:MAG: L-histidine N(Alpha)-methyltransferase [Rhodospirillales bacterium]|nr:L-histidine N(Alpha)-methyltransferase [Rhodospirillales bacterium]